MLEVLTAMAAIYWALGYPQAKLVDWLHRRLGVSEVSAAIASRVRLRSWSTAGCASCLATSLRCPLCRWRSARNRWSCLIGPTGSGKSTLLRCANALELIDGGRDPPGWRGAAADRNGMRQVRQRMGMVFQNFELFPH